jgi:hypothetical protein
MEMRGDGQGRDLTGIEGAGGELWAAHGCKSLPVGGGAQWRSVGRGRGSLRGEGLNANNFFHGCCFLVAGLRVYFLIPKGINCKTKATYLPMYGRFAILLV